MKIRAILLFNFGAVLMLLSGCLTSPNPFYTTKDVFQDDRILRAQVEDGVVIQKHPEEKGAYLFHFCDGTNRTKWAEFTARLFTAGTNTYVDLFPYNDFSLDRVPGVPPSGFDTIRSITRQPVHSVLRIEITDEAIAYSLPQKRAVAEFVQRHPAFTNYVRDESTLLLPLSSPELHKLLEVEGNTLFPKPTNFQKLKPAPQ
jgi:hypothetical protein